MKKGLAQCWTHTLPPLPLPSLVIGEKHSLPSAAFTALRGSGKNFENCAGNKKHDR